MPRRRRFCPTGMPVHIVQRGVNRQAIFTSDADISAYANWLFEAAEKYNVRVHAWVFMTNHVHFLMTPSSNTGIARCLQHLGRHYVRYFNHTYRRTGTLFEGRYRSSLVESAHYLLACSRYIELNPVRAGMVNDPADYTWSSYRCNAFGKLAKVWSPHPEYLALGQTTECRAENYRSLFNSELAPQTVKDIRFALNTGFVLGTDKFKTQVAVLIGQPQSLRKRGPKTKRIIEDNNR